MKPKLERAEMWLYKKMLRKPLMEGVKNMEVLKIILTKITHIHIQKEAEPFPEYKIRKEDSENSTLTEYIEQSRDRRSHRPT